MEKRTFVVVIVVILILAALLVATHTRGGHASLMKALHVQIEVLCRRPPGREIDAGEHRDVGDRALIRAVGHRIDAHRGRLSGFELAAIRLVDVRREVDR